MTSAFRRFLVASSCVVGLGLMHVSAQTAPEDDPFSDLLEQMDETDGTQELDPGGADEFVDPSLEDGEDPFADENDNLPRLAPIFAPDYDPSDYFPVDPDAAEDEMDPVDDTNDEVLDGDAETDEDGLLDEDENELGFDYIQQPAVILRGLDKISGRSTDIEVAVGENVLFGGLRVSVKACHQTPPTEPPESIAYIEVEDYGFEIQEIETLPDEIDLEKRVFNGWMFASSPGLNGLEHAIYDVWVIRCMAEAPVRSEEPSES